MEQTEQKDNSPNDNPIATKAKIGRPTKYKPEYCEMLLDYFNKEAFRISEIRIQKGKDFLRTEEKLLPEVLPTFQRFAWNIGTTNQILLDWANIHPAFKQAYSRAQEIQQAILHEGSTAGVYDYKASALILSHYHKIYATEVKQIDVYAHLSDDEIESRIKAIKDDLERNYPKLANKSENIIDVKALDE